MFLIFNQLTVHPLVYLSAAPDAAACLRAYIRDEAPTAEFPADGSIRIRDGKRSITYPHPLAYIEARCKPYGEWSLRELPEGFEHAPLTEAFCGEDGDQAAYHVGHCRRQLRRTFPRSRARGFLWRLRGGVMVVFYHKAAGEQIEVLGRYVRWREHAGREYEPWDEDYDALLAALEFGPGSAAILQPHAGSVL